MAAPASTDRPHRMFSRFYARMSTRMEGARLGDLRDELLADVHGEVVEVGAGNGLNFTHYPATVTKVTAVEPEPYLRRLGVEAAVAARMPVEVVSGDGERLPLADDSVDAVVSSMVLCSVDSRAAVLAEVGRVLRPGGELRFFEHTLADGAVLRSVQHIADATFWPRLGGGCHTAVDMVDAITGAGFTPDVGAPVLLPRRGSSHSGEPARARAGALARTVSGLTRSALIPQR